MSSPRASGRRAVWRYAVALSLILGLAGACREVPDMPVACKTDASCPSGYHCGPVGTCIGDVPCTADAQCCLAERCQQGRCRKRTMCSANSPCGAAGHRCLLGMCVPASCATGADCPTAIPCTLGLCRASTPCGGHCAPGQACAALLDRCVTPQPSALACGAGQLAVLDNEAEQFQEGCAQVTPAVSCRALGPLPEGDYGWPAALVDAGTSLLVLARDRTYGDLVLARHGRSPPYARQSLVALAGVPEGAPVVGDPKGPRGGVAEPGPDAGDVLDAAVGPAGVVHVAFHRATDDALAYLRLTPDGGVHDRQVIATGQGVGAALALAVHADGRPVVVAFAPATEAEPSALRLYTAKTAAPGAPADWQVTPLASAPLPTSEPPCGGPCGKGQVCAVQAAPDGSDSGTGACVSPGEGCAACLPSQVCSGQKCLTRLLPPAPLHRSLPGIGAHVDVLIRGQSVHVAAWNSTRGWLHLFERGPAGATVEQVLKGQDVPGGSSDIGRFAHLWLDSKGTVFVSCQDATWGRLLRVRPGTPPQVVVSDDGVRTDGHHRVGADVRARATGGGGALAVYQDTRLGRVVVASLGADGVASERVELSTPGAGGFSPGIVALGTKALVVSTTSLSFDTQGGLSTHVTLQSVVLSGP